MLIPVRKQISKYFIEHFELGPDVFGPWFRSPSPTERHRFWRCQPSRLLHGMRWPLRGGGVLWKQSCIYSGLCAPTPKINSLLIFLRPLSNHKRIISINNYPTILLSFYLFKFYLSIIIFYLQWLKKFFFL